MREGGCGLCWSFAGAVRQSGGDCIDTISECTLYTVKREHSLQISCEDYFAQPAWSSGGTVRVAPAASEQKQDEDVLLPCTVFQ